MDFSRERVRDVLPELAELTAKHYLEIALYQDIPLDPDFERYYQVEDMGHLALFVARDEGKIVGYSVFYLDQSIQYRSSYQANQDLLYLDPSYRGKGLGRDFLKWIDEQLEALGVQVVFHHTKIAHDFSPLLEDLGYQHVDKVYARRLDKCVEVMSP